MLLLSPFHAAHVAVGDCTSGHAGTDGRMTFGANNYAMACPAGQYRPSYTAACETCTIGGYCPAGSTAAISCTPGTYNDLVGSTSQDECKPAPVGHFAKSGRPLPCRKGCYQDQLGSTSVR